MNDYRNTAIIIFVVAELCWLYFLVVHLKNRNYDPTEKICWTVVLCVLNVLGLILYLSFAPKLPKESLQESEERIKEAANNGTL